MKRKRNFNFNYCHTN